MSTRILLSLRLNGEEALKRAQTVAGLVVAKHAAAVAPNLAAWAANLVWFRAPRRPKKRGPQARLTAAAPALNHERLRWKYHRDNNRLAITRSIAITRFPGVPATSRDAPVSVALPSGPSEGSGGTVIARTMTAPKGTVILLHGWGGSQSQLRPLGLAMAEAGLSAMTFDWPGHGQSTGTSSDAVEMARLLQAVVANERRQGNEVALVCHSFSLIVAALASRLRPGHDSLATDPNPMAGAAALVSVGSPHRLEYITRQFFSRTALDPRLAERLHDWVQRRVTRAMHLARDFDVRATDFAATPWLAIHDRSDKEVPLAEFEALQQLARTRGALFSALTTDSLGHNRILADRTVMTAATTFVLQAFSKRFAGETVVPFSPAKTLTLGDDALTLQGA